MTRSPQEYLAVATADSHLQDTKELYGNKLAAKSRRQRTIGSPRLARNSS